MKIAAFDVSHWHFPLYLDALKDPGIEVVGISGSGIFCRSHRGRNSELQALRL